jgi:hypothetical protein
VKPTARENQAWVRNKIALAGWTEEIEFAAVLLAELACFLRKLLEGM